MSRDNNNVDFSLEDRVNVAINDAFTDEVTLRYANINCSCSVVIKHRENNNFSVEYYHGDPNNPATKTEVGRFRVKGILRTLFTLGYNTTNYNTDH